MMSFRITKFYNNRTKNLQQTLGEHLMLLNNPPCTITSIHSPVLRCAHKDVELCGKKIGATKMLQKVIKQTPVMFITSP